MKTTDTDSPASPRGRRTSWLLSIIAFSPMAILAAFIFLTDRSNATFLPLLDAFKTASAITLSFLGGIRWGMALRQHALKPLVLAASVIPAAIGWASLFLPGPAAIGILLLAISAMGAWDSFALNSQNSPPWFAKIRTTMTLLAAFAHVAVLLAIL